MTSSGEKEGSPLCLPTSFPSHLHSLLKNQRGFWGLIPAAPIYGLAVWVWASDLASLSTGIPPHHGVLTLSRLGD